MSTTQKHDSARDGYSYSPALLIGTNDDGLFHVQTYGGTGEIVAETLNDLLSVLPAAVEDLCRLTAELNDARGTRQTINGAAWCIEDLLTALRAQTRPDSD